MDMYIASLSVGMQQGKLQQDLGTSILKMAMNQITETGAAVADLMDSAGVKGMELAAQPYLGANMDISA